jgi:hypothetical protein
MTEIQKPVVHYTPTSKDWISKGMSAEIHVVHNHPVLGCLDYSQDSAGGRCITTSRVVGIREDGFETNNTLNSNTEAEGYVFKMLNGHSSFKAISNKWLLKNE